MFDNIERKIETLAVVVCWVGIISSVIIGLIQMSVSFWAGLLTTILGPLVACIGAFVLYGFGQLIEHIRHIDEHTYPRNTTTSSAHQRTQTGQQSGTEKVIYCTTCGTAQPTNRSVCWECGAKLSK